MIIADIIAGILIGTLTGMGVGGAGLLIIYLTAIRGMSQTDAQGINLCFFIFASLFAMLVHIRKRRLYVNSIVFALAGGIPGAYLGCIAASAVSPGLLRKIFGGVLLLTGFLTLFGKKKGKSEKRM